MNVDRKRSKKIAEDLIRSRYRPEKYPTKEIVLRLLGAGLIITAAILAPPTTRVLVDFTKELFPGEWERFHPSRLRHAFVRLKRQGLVEVMETEKGQVVQISDKGKRVVLEYDLESMELDKKKPWDGMWRVIIFDVPEYKKQNRELFRKKLVELGFRRIQRSVFVCPHPCEKEVSYLREVYEIGDNVLFLDAKRIENEDKLKSLFKVS